MSLIVTMTFYMILPIRTEISIESALIVGIVEELAKCVVIILFINSYKANYIFNGVLIGACIGAGFSVFESSGTLASMDWRRFLPVVFRPSGPTPFGRQLLAGQ